MTGRKRERLVRTGWRNSVFCFFLMLCIVWAGIPASALAAEKEAAWSGGGTRINPYLIEDTQDFLKLLSEIDKGNDQAGIYFKQIQSIVIDGEEKFQGLSGSAAVFNGRYDGSGYDVEVRLAFPDEEAGSVFGNIGESGAIYNLSLSGVLSGKRGGPLRSVKSGGVVANCSFNMDGSMLEENSAGAVYAAEGGEVINCYVSGTMNGKAASGFLSVENRDLKWTNVYYPSGDTPALPEGEPKGTATAVARADMAADDFAYRINQYRDAAAKALGINADELCYWEQDGTAAYPQMTTIQPSVLYRTVTDGDILSRMNGSSGYAAENSIILCIDAPNDGWRPVYEEAGKRYDLYYSNLHHAYLGVVPAANLTVQQAAAGIQFTETKEGDVTQINYGILGDDRGRKDLLFQDLYLFDQIVLKGQSAPAGGAERVLALDINADNSLTSADLMAMIRKFVYGDAFTAETSDSVRP